MRAKEFMLQVREAERELLIISAKKRHFTDLMLSIGANTCSSVINKPTGASKTETAAIGLVEMVTELDVKEKEYTALVKKAEGLISKLKSEKFQKFLTLKYLCDWSWKSLRDEMGYKDEKSVYRCNKYALEELQKVM